MNGSPFGCCMVMYGKKSEQSEGIKTVISLSTAKKPTRIRHPVNVEREYCRAEYRYVTSQHFIVLGIMHWTYIKLVARLNRKRLENIRMGSQTPAKLRLPEAIGNLSLKRRNSLMSGHQRYKFW